MRLPFNGDKLETALEFACAMANRTCYRRRLSMNERFELAEWVLEWFGWGDGFFGVEYAGFVDDDIDRGGCWYLNAGDTYDATVCYLDDGYDIDRGGDFFVSSWGDVYEGFENEAYEEDGEVRCGYCSAMTPCGEEYRETRCESCGRNVSTGEVMAEVAEVEGLAIEVERGGDDVDA